MTTVVRAPGEGPAPASRTRRWPTRLLGAAGELLLTAGALVLLFLVWQLWWTGVVADRQQQAVVERLQDRWQASAPPVPAAAAPSAPAPSATTPPPVPPPDAGEPFAVVRIPRFGGDYARPLVEGTGTPELREGIGHYPGTALPGEVGNFAVAGHRTTYGAPLNRVEELRVGDEIAVETATATYVYLVRDWEVVTPDRVDVLLPVPGQEGAAPQERLMTLTTCHPMYSARQRWVTRAVLDRVEPPPAATG